ncbi:AAEL004933-PA [Aedes aegypti]|uniref:Lipase n=1 Tax=Aedes aegypti TaxID=7159 RepID=Q17BM4_AEDAE|nr:AAEL004933-PA [Aedes aegypti]
MWSLVIAISLLAILVKLEAFVLLDEKSLQVEDADAKLSTVELATKYGYRIETHHIQTDDGFLLELHRITGSGSTMYDKRIPPVLLMHGLFASSADWVLLGPGNALAYLLSDMGYDVWLPNVRGNRYSRKHINYTPNMNKFWDFSWHEIATYDLPAIIDYTLNVTSKEKLHYIGHSQGTTVFFVMCSERPEYNEKILLAQGLAPIAFMEHMNSPLLKVMVKHLDAISTIADLFSLKEFKPIPSVVLEVAKYLCPQSKPDNLCVNILFQITGANPNQVDPKMVQLLLGHIPAGSSTKQILHFAQEVRSGLFQQYDHGKLKNMFVYDQPEPPVYNLSRVVAPVSLHYGPNDYLSVEEDVLRLAKQLPNLIELNRIDMELFNHLDFLIAKDVKEILYDKLISNIEQYNY